MRPRSALLLALLSVWPPAVSPETQDMPATWRPLAAGLDVGRFPAPEKSAVGDSMVTVVRVDPARYVFRLLSARLLGLSHNPTALTP